MGRVLLAYAPKRWLDDYLATVDLQPATRHTITSRTRLEQALAQVRRQEFAMADEELEEGLRSITTVRAELLPPLRRAAPAIEADLCTFRSQHR